jgi:hypothetical protein
MQGSQTALGNESVREHNLTDDSIARSAAILLRRVFRILRGCGIAESDLKSMANSALNDIAQIPDQQPSRVTARQALMCCDLVLRWRRDCRYLDEFGVPRILSIIGEEDTFESLVRESAPNIDSKSMLHTLVDLGVVRVLDDTNIELISESVVTCSGLEGARIASECVLEHICGFLGSVEFNVFDKPSRSKGRFERACYARIPKELVPVLQQLIRTRGQDFVDVIDEWMARRTIKHWQTGETMLVGAGAYLFVREDFAS